MITQRRVRFALLGATLVVTFVVGMVIGAGGLVATRLAPAQGIVAAVPADPQGEHLTVHGNWVIEVRNADGSLAERREFENSLLNPYLISRVLARAQTVGPWALEIVGSTPACTSPALFGCWISEPGTAPSATNNFANLTVTNVAGAVSTGDKVQLQGTFTAQQAGDITQVRSRLAPCAPTVAQASANSTTCGTGIDNMSALTSASITPITLTAGQLVQVTVTLSFS